MSQSSIQIRTFDPFTELNSDILNRTSTLIVPGGRAIVKGLECTITNPNVVTVSAGIAVKERVIIEFLDQVDLAVSTTDGYYYVVLSYNFNKVCPSPEAEIRIKPRSMYDSSSDLILNIVRVNGGVAVSVFTYDPLTPTNKREDETLIDTKIDEHNTDPNAHPDIRSMLGGGSGAGAQLVIEAGENLNAGEPVAIVGGVARRATNDETQGLEYVTMVGVVIADVLTGEDATIQTINDVTINTWNFSNAASNLIYLDDGVLTDTLPSTHAVVLAGYKVSSNTIFVAPQVLYLRATI